MEATKEARVTLIINEKETHWLIGFIQEYPGNAANEAEEDFKIRQNMLTVLGCV